jgi:thymidylate synthase (FAD)
MPSSAHADPPTQGRMPFRVEILQATPNPQRLIYLALHNDYSEDFTPDTSLSEADCGRIAVNRLLAGGRGHFGPCEHPSLSVLLQVDHNTAMQLRTHRVGVSFDLQSMRYTSERILKVARGELPVREVFYLRPAGDYTNRQGKSYAWSDRDNDTLEDLIRSCCRRYQTMIFNGAAEEHARMVLPTCYFQNVALTGNLRSWLHLLDVRLKADAQLEIRCAMDLVAQRIADWAPEIYSWYSRSRQGKALLAP